MQIQKQEIESNQKQCSKSVLIDLHSHTTCSDGELTPEQFLQQSINNNVTIQAITDHDTLHAYFELKAQNFDFPNNFIYIPGIEISCNSNVDGKKHHMVALFPKLARGRFPVTITIENESLTINDPKPSFQYEQDFLLYSSQMDSMRAIRIERARKYFENLNKYYNLSLNFTEFAQINKINLTTMTSENVIGRPMIAKYLVELGIVKSVPDAFKVYLSDQSPAFSPLPVSYINENIQKVKNLKGVAFLAHPTLWEYSESEQKQHIIDALKNGIDGIEKYHTKVIYQEEFDCAKSIGSDFHGKTISDNADYEIGFSKGNALMTAEEKVRLIKTLFDLK